LKTISTSEVLITAPKNAHKYPSRRVDVERRRAASPPWGIAPGRRVSHAHKRLKNPAAHGQESDLESFEHGICALEAACGRLRLRLSHR
jgi:hypothetical protein